MNKMFYDCSSLEKFYCPIFDVSNCLMRDDVFHGCSSLKKSQISYFFINN